MTMTRREFVTGTTMAAAAAALPIKLAAEAQPDASNVWQLETQWKDAEWDGHKMRLRCYNGQIPGPMRIVQPGETLRIHLKNSLTHYDSTGWDGNPDVPHMLNTTNLHLH
jgi:FtsP/CotA-like multicopper oxidase with cupredoxin domain